MAKPTIDASLIKKPHLQMAYSTEQALELIKCSDPVTGPLYFLENFFYIQHPTKGKLLFNPFEFQVRLINTYHNNRQSIALCPRQVGKTVSSAGYLLWYAMFNPDSTILIAAHKFQGASEIMQRIRFAYESVPDHIRCGVNDYNKQSISFDNGSRIAAQTTTETTGRGMSITLLYIDEFAFVRPTIAKEFWTSISLTLSTGGKCIITSTPNSDEDQFSEIWRQANKTVDEYGNTTELGVNKFKAFRSYWNEHPDRDEAWLETQRQTIGEERVRRELECEFLIFEETLINQIHLTTMKGVEPISNEGKIRWYKKPESNKLYLVALDPSLGTGGDPAAIEVFEAPGLIQVAEWTHNKTPIEKQVDILSGITKQLDDITGNNNKVYYTVENNTIGEAALVAIRNYGEENINGIFLSETKSLGTARKFRKGLNTTNSSKITACSQLKHVVEHDKIKIYSKPLISELKTFIAVGNTYKAKIGERDDLVMAMISIVRMVNILKNFVPEVEQDSDENIEDFIPMPFISMQWQ
jgi:hypothetical protein